MENQDQNQEKNMNQIRKHKLERLEELKTMVEEPYGRKFDKKDKISDLLNNFEEEKPCKTAGRIMAYRRSGKNAFGHIEDGYGKMQYYIKIDEVGEEQYNLFKKLAVGDFIGVEGVLFKTNSGEKTIRIKNLELLSTNINPLPEKFNGLTDVETRYRERYVDLIINRDVKETFIKRINIIKYIRNYLDKRDFLEVETPMMQPVYGGASAKPFVTHHNALDMTLYMRISPELYLKRLIVGGYERVYEINKSFRNEGISTRHNPEFTMIELYQAYADVNDMMDLTEDMVSSLVQENFGTEKLTYEETEINFAKPWKRMTIKESIKEYTGLDFDVIKTREEAAAAAAKLHIKVEDNMSYYKIMNEIFEEKVESKLIQPTFITEYPKEMSPLAKNQKGSSDFVDRFELFIYGREHANAYSELNDPIDQKERLLGQLQAKEAGDEEAQMMDDDFVNALEYGMPPTGGLGIGIDRLVMMLTNSSSIRDVLFFPSMRKKDN